MIASIVLHLLGVSPAYAAGVITSPNDPNRVVGQYKYFTDKTTPQGIDTVIDGIYGNALTIVFLFLGVAAIAYLIWAGIRYASSGGNPEAAKQARQKIINVFLGLVVLFGVYTILAAIISLGGWVGRFV